MPHDSEDVLQWPDGSWCFRYELYYMSHVGDDYTVLPYGSVDYDKFFEGI